MTEKESNSNQTTRGGKRPGAGRKRGGKNAATLEIEAAAKRYAGDALKALVHVAKQSESDSARVAAASALLDRAYGKPRQSLEHSGELGIEVLAYRRRSA